MKKLILFVILVFSLIIYNNSFSQDHNYKLIISTDKNVYEFADEVYLKIKLINMGKENDTISKAGFNVNDLSTYMEVFNDKGQKLKLNQLGLDYEDNEKVLIPGDSIVTVGELSYIAGQEWIYMLNYLSDGTYKIFLKYLYNEHQFVPSNKIQFTVLPIKESEIPAFNDAKKLSDYYNNAQEPDRIEKFKACTDSASVILYKYPKARFTQLTLMHFYYTRNLLKYKYDTTTIKEIEFFIENNTESKFCKDLLYTAVSIFRENEWGVEKTIEYLNYLKEKFQNETLNKNIDEVCEKNDYLNKR